MTYEDDMRRQMEQNMSAAFSADYPRSWHMRQFAKDSKRLKKLGLKGQRPKAGQRPKE